MGLVSFWTTFYTYAWEEGGQVSWVSGSNSSWMLYPLASDACWSSDKKQRKLQLSGLWSQQHVLHLQGHHGIIQGVACTHSAAEREILFPTTSDTWFARGRARDQERWWAGVVFSGHISSKPTTPFWLPWKPTEFIHYQVWTAITQASRLLWPAMPKSTFQKKKNLK